MSIFSRWCLYALINLKIRNFHGNPLESSLEHLCHMVTSCLWPCAVL